MSVAAQYLDHPGVEITGRTRPGYESILSPAALAFLADLHRRFDPVPPFGGRLAGPRATHLTRSIHCRSPR